MSRTTMYRQGSGLQTDKTLRSILNDWRDTGGWLYRHENGLSWKLTDDLSELVGPIYLAWFPDLDESEIPEGLTYTLVRVRPITHRDIDEAPIDSSYASAYLDVYGYRFRFSDHRAMTQRSTAGVVREMRGTFESPDETESILRDMAHEWLSDQNAKMGS